METALKNAYEQAYSVLKKTEDLKLFDNSNELADCAFVRFTSNNTPDDHDRFAQFIHLATCSTAKSVAEFIIKAYHLPAPDLILSIQTGGVNIGDAANHLSVIPREIERYFQRGVIEAAKLSNAWITTSGINRDANKLVGAALNSDTCGVHVPCVGFGSWQYTTGNGALMMRSGSNVQDPSPAHICNGSNIIRTYDIDNIRKMVSRKRKNCDLESNHTHFLLFDNGTDDWEWEDIEQKRQEIEYELSANVSKEQSEVTEDRKRNHFPGYGQYEEPYPIPIVTLLFGGGFTELISVCDSLKKETPVVIIRHTNNLADIIIRFLENLRMDDELRAAQKAEENRSSVDHSSDRTAPNAVTGTSNASQAAKEKKRKQAEMNLSKLAYAESEGKGAILREKITECIHILEEKISLIVVFDAVEHKGNLQEAVAHALLQGIKARRYKADQDPNSADFYDNQFRLRAEELKWCTIWDKAAHARQEFFIYKDDDDVAMRQTKAHVGQMMLKKALFDALCRTNVRFTRLFMENGASIEKFTPSEIERICEKSQNYIDALPLITSPDWDEQEDLSQEKAKIYIKRWRLWKVFSRRVLPDERFPIGNVYAKKTSDFDLYNTQYLEHYLKLFNSIQQTNNSFEDISDLVLLEKQFKTEKLYLWFLYMNRPEMAQYLCSKSRNQVAATLLAVEIYQKAIEIENEMVQVFLPTLEEFRTHARNIIDKCFKKDQELALDLLGQKAVAFYGCEPLDVARRADCRLFLASDTVKKYLDQKWYHKFDEKRRIFFMPIHVWTAVVSIIFPLLPIFAGASLYKERKSTTFFPKKQRRVPIKRAHYRVSYTMNFDNDVEIVTPLNKPKHSVIEKVIWFYEAPVIRFYYHAISFLLFLVLFSFVLLVDYVPRNIDQTTRSGIPNLPVPITEIILHIYIWSLIIDKIYQFFNLNRLNNSHTRSIWNLVDIFGIVFYVAALITRFPVVETAFIVSKIFMCIAFVIWCVRVLHLFSAYEMLGPKMIMIFYMMQDALVIFICFILLMLFAFSVASWSLLQTNSQVQWIHNNDSSLFNVTITNAGNGEWSWQVIRDVMTWGIWKVFTQIDEFNHNSVSDNDAYGAMVFVFAICFVVIANVLLLNVFIAMFNVTIHQILTKSNLLWRYQRFLLIYEFDEKTVFPPPFNLLCYIYKSLVWCCPGCFPCSSQNNQKTSDDSYSIKQMEREQDIAEMYWKKHMSDNDKLHHVEKALEDMDEKINEVRDSLRSLIDKTLPTRQKDPLTQRNRETIDYNFLATGVLGEKFSHPSRNTPATVPTNPSKPIVGLNGPLLFRSKREKSLVHQVSLAKRHAVTVVEDTMSKQIVSDLTTAEVTSSRNYAQRKTEDTASKITVLGTKTTEDESRSSSSFTVPSLSSNEKQQDQEGQQSSSEAEDL